MFFSRFYDKHKEYIDIVIGVTLIAITLNVFYVPNNLVTGGVSGIGVILLELGETFGGVVIPIWLTNLVINVPLLLLSYKINGRGMFFKTLFAIASLTLALSVTEHIPDINPDLIISTIFGGGLIGVGAGFVIRRGATTGGTVLMAAIIQRFMRHFKITTIQLSIDVIIILVGLFIFGVIETMHAIVSIFISIKVIDTMIQGLQSAKAVVILSQKSEEVSKALITSMERGVTAIPSRGVYSGESKDMLLCIMSQKELVKTKALVKEIDPKSFVMVASVTEVMGGNFKPLD